MLDSRELDLLTNSLDSTLVNDWGTFLDLFGGQGVGEEHSELESYEYAVPRP